MLNKENLNKLKSKKENLLNPFYAIENFCSKIIWHITENGNNLDFETLERLYLEEDEELKNKIKNLMLEIVLIDPRANNLLDEANDILNP
jgi:DNA polymerase I-like protein with 3'-5' exonuclease and polymerase domains